MRILFTICGRAGSKGIKNKNIRDLCGKPLAYYTVSVISLFLKKHPDVVADVVVSSDSTELLEMMKRNTMLQLSVIEREAKLSGDSVGKVEVIRDCLEKMQGRNDCIYDMVVDLDITSPLRRVEDLENVIETQKEANADVTITVTEARRNPYFNQVKKTSHGYKRVVESEFTARQQAPQVYDMNASIYGYNPLFLKNGKCGVLDGYCEAVQMFDTGVLDLDHENDFALMEIIAEHLFKCNAGFKEIFDNI